MNNAVIHFENVNFSYESQSVLKNVNLSVTDREFTCLIGPNGGGKTTLVLLMLGLLKPDNGKVTVLGKPAGVALEDIGYVPQHASFDPQFPVSVQDVVLMGRLGQTRGFGFYSKADRKIARQALEKVEMLEFCSRRLTELSGGQRQRVLIARALACTPKILLLDEPTSNLDTAHEQEFYDLLKKLSADLTIIMVSHDVGFVSHEVAKVVCVNRSVKVHPTAELTGELISELYGLDMRLVRHDHNCIEKFGSKGADHA